MFKVSYRVAGKQRTKSFPTAAEAYQFQKDMRVQFIQLGNSFDVLPPKQRSIVMQCLLEMEKFGTSISDVWAFYKRHNGNATTIKEAWPLFLEAKKQAKLRDQSIQYYHNLQELWGIVGEDTPLRLVTPAIIDKWARSKGKAPRSFIKYVRLASGFFSWAKRQGMTDMNPAMRVEMPRVDQHEPNVLSNQDIRKILEYTEDKPLLRCYIILGLYAGLRPDETMRMEWSCIKDNQIILTGDVTKTRRRRVVTLLGNAADALRKTNAYRLSPEQPNSLIRTMCKKIDVKWGRDCLRHTASSHMINVYRSLDEVALQLGNSPSVIRSHYMGIVTPQQTEEFLGLL